WRSEVVRHAIGRKLSSPFLCIDTFDFLDTLAYVLIFLDSRLCLCAPCCVAPRRLVAVRSVCSRHDALRIVARSKGHVYPLGRLSWLAACSPPPWATHKTTPTNHLAGFCGCATILGQHFLLCFLRL